MKKCLFATIPFFLSPSFHHSQPIGPQYFNVKEQINGVSVEKKTQIEKSAQFKNNNHLNHK